MAVRRGIRGVRVALLLVTAVTGSTLVARLLLPPLAAGATALRHGDAGAASFETVLTAVCAAAVALSWCWLCLAGSAVAVDSMLCCRVGDRRPARPARLARRCPGWLRVAVLVGCGVGLGGALSSASADTSGASVLDGLPVPDRFVSRPAVTGHDLRAAAHDPPRAAAAAARRGTVTVVSGDSLWTIAASLLPPDAGPARITRTWRLLYVHNRQAVGADPNLIVPGTVLGLPSQLPR